jgi:hypothetical protein
MKHATLILLVISIVLAISTLLKCDLIISQDTTWTNRQIDVDGDLIVNQDVFLDIESGVTVSMKPGKSIMVKGLLKVVGTSENPVVFNCSSLGARWGRLYFDGVAQHSTVDFNGEYQSNAIIRHATFMNSDQEYSIEFLNPAVPDRNHKFYLDHIEIVNSGGIRGLDTGLYIRNSILQGTENSYENAIRLITTMGGSNGFSYLSARDCVFEKYNRGVFVEDCKTGSVSEVLGCTFESIESSMSIESSCNITIAQNTLHSSKIAIIFPAGSIFITDNIFSNCEADTINLMQSLPSYFLIKNNSFINGDISRGNLINTPSWKFSYQIDVIGNRFNNISSAYDTGTLLTVKEGTSRVDILQNVFTNIETHNNGAMFIIEKAESTRINNNTFNSPKSKYVFNVRAPFGVYPILDARFNRWIDSKNSTDIKKRTIDFEANTELAYTSLFPALVGSDSKFIYRSDKHTIDHIIVKDTTWSDVITTPGSIIVEVGVHLKITPGSIIKLPESASIIVLGGIIAQGTEERNIEFQNLNDGTHWHKIFIAPSAYPSRLNSKNVYVDGSILEYVNLLNANKARFPVIHISHDNAFVLRHVSISVDGWVGSSACIYAKPTDVDSDLLLIVRASDFDGCYTAIHMDGDERSTMIVTESTFRNNDVGVECSSAMCKISQSSFGLNGIALSGSNIYADNNIFVKNKGVAISSGDNLILRHNKFADNNVDVELSSKSMKDYIWENNVFNSPDGHFFTTYTNEYPEKFTIQHNTFMNGKCSPRSTSIMELKANDMVFYNNTIEGCNCYLGDIVRLQVISNGDFQFNTFRNNYAHQVPSTPQPSIFLTDASSFTFSYNAFEDENNSSFLFYRDGQAKEPIIDLSLNYWGSEMKSSEDILQRVGSTAQVEINVTPFLVSSDFRDIEDNLMCDHGYIVDPATRTCVKSKHHPKNQDDRLMIVFITFIWLGTAFVIASFVALIILFIRQRKQMMTSKNQEESYVKQEDVELKEPPRITTPSSP